MRIVTTVVLLIVVGLAAHEWSPGKLFWITRHGVKMTGMPAFGPSHEDAELWDLVAFLGRLPQISADDYRGLRATSGEPD